MQDESNSADPDLQRLVLLCNTMDLVSSALSNVPEEAQKREVDESGKRKYESAHDNCSINICKNPDDLPPTDILVESVVDGRSNTATSFPWETGPGNVREARPAGIFIEAIEPDENEIQTDDQLPSYYDNFAETTRLIEQLEQANLTTAGSPVPDGHAAREGEMLRGIPLSCRQEIQ
ncbi:hypothetical protein MPH_13990 [Macrophomina phaseolina MS6]|uniref:Uncharacterized protein n=1 Tax=Macrophomina phaseolina (strain MS6) TaxID=1126212 RepID=K2R804_MACPH|nr:hypothetical protein MPH_13990 [Macrophomina phaseolina MS6]